MTREEIMKLNMEQLETRKTEIKSELAKDGCDVDALTTEVDAIEEREKSLKDAAEKRSALTARVNAGEAGTVFETGKTRQESAEERAAQAFAQTGRMEMRALLSTGKIAKPTKATGINDLVDRRL